ncbi:MAG: VOC family protein [Solirubrobacteraceae bacterium]
MHRLSFGQPLGGIIQFAYVVDEIEAAAERFTDRLRVGPWFVRGPFTPPAGRYRGEPTAPLLRLARGFSGHAMVELIQQHDETPSVYHPVAGERRYGFHHWATIAREFDAELARYAGLGYQEAYSDQLPSGSRVVYMDTRGELPGMIEVIEHTSAQEAVYDAIHRAAIDWDGADPIRQEQ